MNIEIMGEGATKGTALTWLCEHLASLADAWAFGDNINDIPMLQAAGHGMATINAEPRTAMPPTPSPNTTTTTMASPAPSWPPSPSRWGHSSQKRKTVPAVGRKGTSPTAGLERLSSTRRSSCWTAWSRLQPTTRSATALARARFHRAARADKANDLVVVHRVAKRHDLVASTP